MPKKVDIDIFFHDLVDISNPHRSLYIKFLYDLLKERLKHPEQNISHKKLPTLEQHIDYVNSQMYNCQMWDIVTYEDDPTECIGTVYLTDRGEIGLHIAEKHQGKGFGTKIIERLLGAYPGEDFYANINPNNKRSKKFFEKFGFSLVQHTYAKLGDTD